MRKLGFSIVIYLLLISTVSAYQITYRMQSISENPDNAINPTVFWDETCSINITMFATAGSAASYTLSNFWFSPDTNTVGSSVITLDSNITCRNLGTIEGDFDNLNGFYETGIQTVFSADDFENWILTGYDCDFDENEFFIYNNTAGTDSFGFHPFGYIERAATQCNLAGKCNDNPLTDDIDHIITILQENLFTDSVCDVDMNIDEIAYNSFSCGAVGVPQHWGRNDWTMTPFNSMFSGVVNISVDERQYAHSADCAQITNDYQIYLLERTTNTTIDLGTTLPFSTTQFLSPNGDYWLLIGSRTCGQKAGIQTCSVSYLNSTYNISVWAFEPDFVCGEFGECIEGIQTRVCVDQEGRLPNRVEYRTCFDVPTFDLTLGFEEIRTIDDGVYLCQKQFWLLTCLLDLQTIDALYPVNWTVFPDLDGSGIARDNFIKMSAETASVGSRSLKMWYIPPKLEEPVSDGGVGTVCGNSSEGSVPEAQHPYNETMFVSQNVTFENPFAQIRYDVRKCNEPVLQYDLTPFGCGELCYAGSCNETPSGRYGVRIARLNGQMLTTFPTFSFFDNAGVNETENVTDGNISTFSDFTSGSPGAIVNATGNIFFNGTFINFTLNTTGSLSLCIFDGATEIRRVIIGSADTMFNFNITLGNLSAPTNTLSLIQCIPPARTVKMRLFSIRNDVLITTRDILFDYIGEAPNTWDAGQIIHDLSNIGLTPGINYTISVAVNPENQFDPLTHCVYMDNFRVTFTETALPECISECIEGTIDRRIGSLSNGICTFITQTNSPDCIGDLDERDAVSDILLGLGGGEVTDNSTCIDSDNDGISDDLFIFDFEIGFSELIIDSAACLLLINQTAEQDRTTQPLLTAEAWLDWIFFLVSPIFIYFYIALAISGAVGAFVKAWEAFGVTFATCLFIGMLITVPGGTAPIIPIWIGVVMIAVVSLMIASKLKNISLGLGGG